MTSPRLHTGQKRVSLFELGNTQKTNILINNEVQHEYDQKRSSDYGTRLKTEDVNLKTNSQRLFASKSSDRIGKAVNVRIKKADGDEIIIGKAHMNLTTNPTNKQTIGEELRSKSRASNSKEVEESKFASGFTCSSLLKSPRYKPATIEHLPGIASPNCKVSDDKLLKKR